MNTKKAKPFLKWAGGKKQLIKEIEKTFPYNKEDSFTYIEPFLGGGAILFWVLENFPNLKKAIANDVNKDLIDVYKVVRDDVDNLIEILSKYDKEYNALPPYSDERKAYYYDRRREYNFRKNNPTKQAALFIFLNRTCFNGLYRVNSKDRFNVPVGKYKNPTICDEPTLRKASRLLQKVELSNTDFEYVVENIPKNSVFYFDPPYQPISSTANFTSYTKDGFEEAEHKRLASFCNYITNEGEFWILSSPITKKSPPKNLKWKSIAKFNARRSINSNGEKRNNASEMIITNRELI